jgi:hypothetical protein
MRTRRELGQRHRGNCRFVRKLVNINLVVIDDTDVSKMLRVASVIGVRTHYSIEVGTKLRGIDSGGVSGSIGNRSARHKSMPNWPQFCHRRTVAANNEGSSGLYLTKHCG